MDNPLIFIPGLFGSMGNDVIRGTGEFSFGLASKIYVPFIKTLLSMGYIENQSLFIAFYDWKNTCEFSSEKYLIPTIEKAKRISSSKKVNLICHSMGGLVARAYIQGKRYRNDVDKIIMIGTPNSGVVKSYYFWGGGKIPYFDLEENLLYKGFKAGLGIYFKIFKKMDYVNLLRETFPGVRDLLPSNEYGNYLILKSQEKDEFIPVRNMNSQNVFLNDLSKERLKNFETYLISGIGKRTSKYLTVEYDKYKNEWTDGKPEFALVTNLGDGTVTLNSSSAFCGEKIEIKGDHGDILCGSRDYISDILGKRRAAEIPTEKMECIYVLISSNINRADIAANMEDSKISTQFLEENHYLSFLYADKKEDFNIFLNPIKEKDARAVLIYIDNKNEIKILFNKNINKKVFLTKESLI